MLYGIIFFKKENFITNLVNYKFIKQYLKI